jgi:cob(I)alamin adenosyltransferase
MMAEVSAAPENSTKFRTINSERVSWLEEQVDTLSQMIEMPNEFIVPGDTPAGAALDLARTIVRRAERQVANLLHKGDLENEALLNYLNRLSSLCFVLELLEIRSTGKTSPTFAKMD